MSLLLAILFWQLLPGTAFGDDSSQGASLAVTADAPRLADVRALIYSTTHVELFWSQTEASDRVEVAQNGSVLGVFDARSLFRDGLDPTREHVFELRPVFADGNRGRSWQLRLFTGDFTLPIRQVLPEVSGTSPSGEGSNTGLASDDGLVDTPVNDPSDAQTANSLSPGGEAQTVADLGSVQAGDCPVHSLAELGECLSRSQDYQRINIRSDLTCSNGSCCPSGRALVHLSGARQLQIIGNGKRLLRASNQRQCSLLDIEGGNDITVRDWRLDDDAQTQPCVVNDQCPRMVHIRQATNVQLQNVEVHNGKGYAIYVQAVDGFGFINSLLSRSGVLGLYIGHDGQSSSRVRVEGSTFIDNQTNALALLGVHGGNAGTNVIANNVFERNHYRGQWPVEARYGSGLTGGGQVYIAQASGVSFINNRISDGYCENCFVQGSGSTGVSGLEIGRPGRQSVSNLLVSGNLIEQHDSFAIYTNSGVPLDGSVQISGNTLIGNRQGIQANGATQSSNAVDNQ